MRVGWEGVTVASTGRCVNHEAPSEVRRLDVKVRGEAVGWIPDFLRTRAGIDRICRKNQTGWTDHRSGITSCRQYAEKVSKRAAGY